MIRGMLDLPTLHKMVDSHEIDTVLVVFPDLQGRLVGKRVTGHYFLDHVAADGARSSAATTCSRSTST